ncbi:hypothetical protein [uncultured Deefgea sp.]|uniref:hypothetical protein n=1 Tax=uncultured Deefgea sp. TaxID=1304914 RepID=UPI0025948443|nr:hypothetical protein [uncultured Deefgea sp.]
MPNFKPFLTLIALAFSTYGHAAPFELSATMGDQTQSSRHIDAEKSVNIFYKQAIRPGSLFNNYTGKEAVTSTLNFRGLPIIIAYPDTSSKLEFSIPSTGLSKTFQGRTREQSQALFLKYLSSRSDLLSEPSTHLIELSPIDLVAGNSNSLMSRGVSLDAQTLWFGSDAAADEQRFSAGINYTHMQSSATARVRAMHSDGVTLPLAYAYNLGQANHELIVSTPLGYTDAEGSKSYDANLGLSYRYPVNSNWTLGATSSARFTGSNDLGTSAWIGSAAIASSYVWEGDGWHLTLGNLLGYYNAFSLRVDSNTLNPDIANTVFRNGLFYSLDSQWEVGGDPLSWEIYLINTQYTGTKLFSNHQNEVGVRFGRQRNEQNTDIDFHGGVSFSKGENLESWQVNFGAWF